MFCKFIANNVHSDEYGIVCVNFGLISSPESVASGGTTSLTTNKTPVGSKFNIISQEYNAPITFNFQIMKTDGSDISLDLERALTKWLCKRGLYIPFQIEDDRYRELSFNVNISNPKVIRVSDTVGMEFTVTCDSPFAKERQIVKTYNITTANQMIRLMVDTDDETIYPDIEITVNSGTTLEITNTQEIDEHYKMIFTNIAVGEVISIKGNIPTISSNKGAHIWKDFNKRWFRLYDGVNTITFSQPCKVVLKYYENRRVGV